MTGGVPSGNVSVHGCSRNRTFGDEVKRPLRGFDPERLVAERRRVGLSRGELGRLIGASTSAVQTWETGRVTPHVNSLAKAAKVLGVEISVLVDVPPEKRFLADLRVLRGLTQPQLAAAAGMSTTTLSALEWGQTRLDDQVAARLGEVLNVDAAEVKRAWTRTRNRPTGGPPR